MSRWIARFCTSLPGASAWDGYVATVVANRAIQAYRTGERVVVDLPATPALYREA